MISIHAKRPLFSEKIETYLNVFAIFRFNIIHTALISAKTGFGIEELITEIFLKYTNVKLGIRSDVYLIGCTNAGKSLVQFKVYV